MKLRLFNNMRISWLLAGGYIVMFLLMIIIGGTSFWISNSMKEGLKRVYIGVPVMSGISATKYNLAKAQGLEIALLNAEPGTMAFEEAQAGYLEAIDGAKDEWATTKNIIRRNRGEMVEGEEESAEEAKKSAFDRAIVQWEKGGRVIAEAGTAPSFDSIDEVAGHLFDAVDALVSLEDFYFNDAEGVTEQAKSSQVFASQVLGGVCAVGFLLAIFLSISITRIITKPLNELSLGVSRMANGQLQTRLNTNSRTREMSLLMQGFSAMVATLRDQVAGLTDGASTIAVSTSQISTTATELASTASEASISVNQITTTAEEVKQTVQLSTEKANQVADAAEEVARVADQGRKATEDAVSGMARIKEEMEYIAESIVKLSEQTQSIGEIIDAVNDLANESNLLSVNASIEAAKAGEFGKGFAVVAQEVKSLSDQSKQSTAQVRTILNDIQNATSQAVMATERGSKAVDAGVDLASSAGHSIRALADSISVSAKSAAQIAASSRQQLAGMDQLAQAMGSIQDAAGQNVDGAKRLEDATHDLSEIAETLKELADKFDL